MDTLGTLILLARVTKDWKPEKNDGSLASHLMWLGLMSCSCTCEHLHGLCDFPRVIVTGASPALTAAALDLLDVGSSLCSRWSSRVASVGLQADPWWDDVLPS